MDGGKSARPLKILTRERMRRWDEDGFIFPVQALRPEKVAGYRTQIEDWLAARPRELSRIYFGSHAFAPWLEELHPAFLDTLEDLIGPDFVSTSTAYRIKEPRSADVAGWHQDAYYNTHEPFNLTALIAFTDCTVANGCLHVVAGSHKWGLFPHTMNVDAASVLSKNQRIAMPFDKSKIVAAEIKAGECVIFTDMTIHGSPPNASEGRRINCLVDVCPTYCTGPDKKVVPAKLLRGADTPGHFITF